MMQFIATVAAGLGETESAHHHVDEYCAAGCRTRAVTSVGTVGWQRGCTEMGGKEILLG